MTNPLNYLAVYCFARMNEESKFWSMMYKIALKLELWRFL